MINDPLPRGLPLSTEQGTWDVYYAGAGGLLAAPDLLFAQVAVV